MIRNKLIIGCCFLLVFFQAKGQEFDASADPKIEQAKGMVETLAYYFNLLGGTRTSVSEKETIINSSYLKLFANEKVQVEDDLQENRSTVTYKDIQAYLKDIDFFFEEAVFDFEVEKVEKLQKDDQKPYYRVELIRNLEAVSLGGEEINSTKKRYIELNADANNELKIASIYTTKISKEKQLREWWSGLTLEWKKVFKKKLGLVYDSLSKDELFNLATIDSLDLKGKDLILDLEPIYQLTSLKHLRISNTWVNDLKPLLSINKLQSLDVSNTSVFDLQYLKYHKDIRKLNLSNSHVEDFSVLTGFDKLTELNLNGIAGTDLSFLEGLNALEVLSLEDAKGIDEVGFGQIKSLRSLHLKNSDVSTVQGIVAMSQLSLLDLSATEITSLAGFENLKSLQTLRIDNTEISDLTPLLGLTQLKMVYANGAALTDEAIDKFNSASRALLITNSDQLMVWWNELPSPLKNKLGDVMGTFSPEVEDLSALVRLDSLDASQSGLKNLSPLTRFQSLKYLNLDGNRISVLNGQELSSRLVMLSVNNTDINTLSNLSSLRNLERLEAKNTAIRNLDQVAELPKLELLDADGSNVSADQVVDLLKKRPKLNIRFMSDKLLTWWADLPPNLKRAFGDNVRLSSQPDRDELHTLVAQESLSFNGVNLNSEFEASLQLFFRLKELKLQQVRTNLITDLPELPELESLALLQMPIADLSGISSKYPSLKRLNITNTAVEDLRPLSGLTELEMLNCSGTNVKRFRGLENLQNMKEIDCSNTKVFRLDRLSGLQNLEKITCFNTGLRQNDIDKLLESLPDVEIVFY
ncbi:hypothetical protein [uncultured Roseivirga sp.]|uniref:leucine-rich repeat domain-containing protein n=1 Tax=uncultured Roseivirga sp. TaxID=543088 RepID=UPI000D7AAF41|nr:hypothetical protein [uncultured Roseivirga sp.]PWL29212.1 MAG: hypothetical protein DCO95_12310 [Roseivirga sp. XM-24bin3]